MDQLSTDILMRMRTKHFLVLEVLSRVESMRATANELNMTQPAVTKIVQDIESILGVTLFERKSTGIVPTPIGRSVLDFSRSTVSDVERFAGLVSNLKLGGYGNLSLGALMAGMPSLVPRALSKLKTMRPLMTIHLVAATSDQLLEALAQHTIEVAVARLTDPQQSATFSFEPMLNEEIWVFVNKDHPLARRDDLSMAELYEQPWVLQPPMSPLRRLLQAAFADEGFGALPNWIETMSIYATLKIVGHTNMIAALPRTIVEDPIKAGEFAKLPITLSRHLVDYGIVMRRGEEPTENSKLFAQILRETARTELLDDLAPDTVRPHTL